MPPGFESSPAIDEAFANAPVHTKHEVQRVRAETHNLYDLGCSSGSRPRSRDPGLMSSKAGIVSILLGN
jgi:hypothetical protein